MLKQLGSLKVALAQLPITKITGRKASKPSGISAVWRFTVHILIIINQTQKVPQIPESVPKKTHVTHQGSASRRIPPKTKKQLQKFIVKDCAAGH